MPQTPRPDSEHGRPVDSNSRATVSGPAETPSFLDSTDDLTAKLAATNELAAMMPANPTKAAEYDPHAAVDPPAGVAFSPDDPIVGASTVQEAQPGDKVGSGSPVSGVNKTIAPLDRKTICDSAFKTRRLVVADGTWHSFGSASEIITSVAENLGDKLKAKPVRVTLPDSHTPMSSALEPEYYPDENDIVAAVRTTLK